MMMMIRLPGCDPQNEKCVLTSTTPTYRIQKYILQYTHLRVYYSYLGESLHSHGTGQDESLAIRPRRHPHPRPRSSRLQRLRDRVKCPLAATTVICYDHSRGLLGSKCLRRGRRGSSDVEQRARVPHIGPAGARSIYPHGPCSHHGRC